MSEFRPGSPDPGPLFAWGENVRKRIRNSPEVSSEIPNVPNVRTSRELTSGPSGRQLPDSQANTRTCPDPNPTPLRGGYPDGNSQGVSPRCDCGDTHPTGQPGEFRHPSAPDLRPYQREAIAAIELELGAGRRTLLEMATGTGKTVTFAAVADFVVAGLYAAVRAGRRVLVLAHRTELLTQALNKLRALGLDAAIEQADKRAGTADVVVASVQTLRGKRLAALDRTEFGLVIVDEAHHAAAKSYRAIVVEHFAGVPVLGVTATPDRGDGQALGVEHGGVFETCCYRYELRQAIADGYLVKIAARVVELKGVSLAKIRTVGGDLDQQQLAEVMADEEAVLGVVIPLLEQAGDRPTVLFAVNVAHAYALAEALCDRRPGCARAAHGDLDADDRAEVLRAFRAREFQFLVNVELYTEGFDEPIVACVASAAPTKSRAKHMQRVGRGTRLLGLTYAESVANGKPDLLVLDFVGDSGRHKLVSPLDALAPGDVADDVREEAERMLAEGAQDLDALLEEAERRIREKRAAARKTANADYFTRSVDPFFGDELASVNEYVGKAWAQMPATQSAIADLERITRRTAPQDRLPPTLTVGELDRIRRAVSERLRRGLVVSQPMIRTLTRYGLREAIATMPHDTAKAVLDFVGPATNGDNKWLDCSSPHVRSRVRTRAAIQPVVSMLVAVSRVAARIEETRRREEYLASPAGRAREVASTLQQLRGDAPTGARRP